MSAAPVTRRRLLQAALAATALTASPIGPRRQASAQLFGGGGGIGGVVRTLQEILQNAERQLSSLQNILAGADLTGAGNIIAELQEVQDLFGDLQAIGYQVQSVARQFDALFPETYDDLTLAEALGVTERFITNSRATIRHALQVQAEVVNSQLFTAAQTKLLTTAAAAGGPTAALQSIAQLQAVQIQQMARLQGLLASQSRLFATELAQIQAIERRAEKIRQDYRNAAAIERDPAPIVLER